MKYSNDPKIKKLLAKGVKIPNPQSIEIGPEVEVSRVSGQGVSIHSGCKIYGASTYIGPNVTLGFEGPVTLVDCQLGNQVELKGGYFKASVFLEKVQLGLGAHVREATIMEEESSGAHTVGLKQTILFPFVTLGSLINFCDCLMAGGTSRRNHSEVGSSYIHFNFTPHQDKATASLIGDVPRGVMLNQKPIFLGGQGGMVGPCRLGFGSVLAAGTICRKDELRPNRLMASGMAKNINIPFDQDLYHQVKRIVTNNLIYIANLTALRKWYQYVRSRFLSAEFTEPLYEGLQHKLAVAIDERIKRVGQLSEKVSESLELCHEQVNLKLPAPVIIHKKELKDQWPSLKDGIEQCLEEEGDIRARDRFLEKLEQSIERWDKNYLRAIRHLHPENLKVGTQWLQSILDRSCDQFEAIIPSFKPIK
jgi:UDP-N-acetylglucosamine/UDP-N-acetylgalactosamine diphosphorylase